MILWVNAAIAFWALWVFWMLIAAFSVYNLWTYRRLMAVQDASSKAAGRQDQKRAVVIIPIKGLSPLTSDFYRSLLNQDYSDYRLIFCFESDRDRAAEYLRKELGLAADASRQVPASGSAAPGLREILLVSAGHARDCGQKIHNQCAAMRAVEDSEELIAFADADMLCGSDWLSRLLAPLNSGSHHLVGTYRWFIPETTRFVNLLASVINASVATLGGPEKYTLLWGGSMALTRRTYEDLKVPQLFEGSLNDDLHLSRAGRRAGYRIGYVRSLLVPSPINFDLRSFVEFSRRQYYQVRHYTPKIYTGALVGTGIYTLGWTSSLAAALSGYGAAWIPFAAVAMLDQFRAAGRFKIIRTVFDEADLEKLRRTRLLEHCATPLWMAVHGLLAGSALFMGHVSWSGITYRVSDRQKTNIISRADAVAD